MASATSSSAASTAAAGSSNNKLKEIREGSAVLKVGSDVFYNNVQNVNRDFSVLALNVFAEQWQREKEARAQWKRDGVKGWRKSVLTWDNWGTVSPPTEPQKQADAVAPKEDNNKSGENEAGMEEEYKKVEVEKEETALPPNDDGTFRILEALSASGLRSIRYAKEVAPDLKKRIIANDREQAAVESIRTHTAANGPYVNGTVIEPSLADAVDYMHARRKEGSEKFHVVDLDPYGAPSEFLDSAVQCIEDGGLLCVTATDTAVLCGSNMDKARPKYGAVALHRPYSHEMAIRLVLSCIDSHANRHNKFIVPLLSLKLDFYIRVFVRVHGDHLNEVKRSALRQSHVLQSKLTDCFRVLPMMTDETTRCVPARQGHDAFAENVQAGALGGWMIGGPMWSAPMQNPAFVNACLEKMKTFKKDSPHMKLKWADRVEGTLAAVKEELLDVPLYYSTASLCKMLHCSSLPLEKFQAALMNGGFRVSQCHHNANVIKTDASSEVVLDILRCWIEKHPISKKRIEEDPLVEKLLSVPAVFRANFDAPRALREARSLRKQNPDKNQPPKQAPKWPHNPEKYWGPKARADRHKPPTAAAPAPASSANEGSKRQKITPSGQDPKV